MVIDMNEQALNTVAQLRAFLNGTQEVRFEPQGEDSQRYALIAAVVGRLRYGRLSRPDKEVVMRYLERTTGYSPAQLKRLVHRARTGERLIKRYTAPEPGFARKFTFKDILRFRRKPGRSFQVSDPFKLSPACTYELAGAILHHQSSYCSFNSAAKPLLALETPT